MLTSIKGKLDLTCVYHIINEEHGTNGILNPPPSKTTPPKMEPSSTQNFYPAPHLYPIAFWKCESNTKAYYLT